MKAVLVGKRSVQSGQAIVLVALAMIGLLAFAVLALDGGRYYELRRVNQNAADQASLAGIYYFAHNASTRTPQAIWNTITAAANVNGIVNTAASTSDGRRVVQAYWIKSDGSTLSEFTDTTSTNISDIPSTAVAIKVTTRIEYQTSMGALIGAKILTAEGSSLARESTVQQAPSQSVWPYSGYLGGVECDNGQNNAKNDQYALELYSGNNPSFNGALKVNGNGGFFSINSLDMLNHAATVTNYVDVLSGNGAGAQISHQNPNNTQPSLVNNVTTWTSPTTPVNGSGTNTYANAWPSIMYVPGETHPLDASDFEPAHGAVTGGYMYKYWVSQNPGVTPSTLWHYYADQGGAVANGNVVGSAGSGVYWINGDVSLTVSNGLASGITVVSTGKVDFSFSNNSSFGSAGTMAANISVLAGKDPGTGLRCANSTTNSSNWIFHTLANQSYYNGFIYAPYGMVLFEGNGNNGHYQAWGVYANSLMVGSAASGGTSGNNMNFDYQQQFTIPIPTSGLMGN